jgi:hypothetical protein
MPDIAKSATWHPQPSREDLETLNIVLSPGRVGTTTIYYNLNYQGVKLYKLHSLDRDKVTRLLTRREEQGKNKPAHLTNADEILRNVIQDARKVNVVIPTREPVSRHISGFARKVKMGEVEIAGKSDEDILREFEDFNPESSDRWLRKELLPLFPSRPLKNIDPGADLNFFADGRFRVMIAKLETPDAKLAGALSAFFERDISLQNRKETSNQILKTSGDARRASQLIRKRISDDYVEKIHAGIYARTFYTADALREHLQRYLNR